ncbi:hypothetical protein RXV95_15310 [Novosphingobium sp. ZN18A2]|uniref:polysaccharide deacetylase family protein n=1 Tax=Novosphingobium sp. ZN18A2 TaxID=3079861 RepID=UPI0030CC5FFB
MTSVYITIDTEYSAAFAAHGREEAFARSIRCDTPGGEVGIGYQMDVFDRHGIKAVFFVDPMPALLWGVEAIADVVGPIVSRGHDVQLHLHTEWLALAGPANPLDGRTGTNIKDFAFDDQCELIAYAAGVLQWAGAPFPVAFRAGNYGADDDTLRALAELGLRYDTSHCPGIAGSLCDISLGPEDRQPMMHEGVVEVPVGCIGTRGEGLRHAQVTALGSGEMLAAINHAVQGGVDSFTIVSHSFELLSRDRLRANRIVKHRFERFCQGLARLDGAQSATFARRPPAVQGRQYTPVLPPGFLRTGQRLSEQLVANALYGAR